MVKEGVTGYVARKREDAQRRNGNGNKDKTDVREERRGYREKNRVEEARGISWADTVIGKDQQEDVRKKEKVRRGETHRRNGRESTSREEREEDKEVGERRDLWMEKRTDDMIL